jgi:hypothetical protein
VEHYVGLDVSLKLTAICVVDGTGKIVREGAVASNPEAIAAFVKSHAPHVARIRLETGAELGSKRLALLIELVPRARRIAVLLNPGNAAAAETTIREAQEAAGKLGLQILSFNATSSEQRQLSSLPPSGRRVRRIGIAFDGRSDCE